jgi:3-hydroxy acid dehydrogenase/malonic semialdehyde reductase
MAALKGKTIVITGASMGIGAAIAERLSHHSANIILLARTKSKLDGLAERLQHNGSNVLTYAVNVQEYAELEHAISDAVKLVGPVDVLVNNAGLALGAPNAFPDLKIQDIITMTNTNINGLMFSTYAALNSGGMKARQSGTILNITSVTGLEVPPFPGESVYHASKAAQEGFTNALRTELCGTNIRVLALRPGVVDTNFHEQRVGYDKEMNERFMDGYEPLVQEDVAEAADFMLSQGERVSVKALDVVPTAQRSLQVFDREWSKRNHGA